jgi:hypothetical protein
MSTHRKRRQRRQKPASVLTEEEMRCLRRSAWRRQGVLVIRPEDIKDDWTRQAMINEAERLFGPRSGGSKPAT